jgi:type III secretion protein V
MNLERINRLLLIVTSRNDLLLVLLLVSVIFMMILPLPTMVVDFLIAANMSLAAVLLMVAIYIKSPLSFSAFPSVLLITTLFRLALSITTTRLILLQADAGAIIDTFGNFVVAGNLIVGLVIFLIITIVQFVVITKGSERVAEVSARFSLDAMPGKQMSIDSDMRAGLIEMDEAKRRRTILEKESQLYGAMDGAMKFVKGDAIAGLIIAAVNIIGGISIGTLQLGMSAGEALQRYSILTIGDGLVSQIPALFISITAGMIVTRVTTDESENLGADIGTQLMAQPKALMVGAGIMLGFAMIPGFPTPIFLILALVAGGMGYVLSQMALREEAGLTGGPSTALVSSGGQPSLPASASATQPARAGRQQSGSEPADFALTVPLMMDVATDVQTLIQPQLLNDELIKVRRALYFDLGVPFPGIHLRYNDKLKAGSYYILMQEIPMSQGALNPGKVFLRDDPDHLNLLGVQGAPGDPFLPGLPTIWVDQAHKGDLAKAGIAFMDAPQILTYHLSYVLKKYAAEFIGVQETRFLLTHMEGSFPELVKEAQRVLPLQKITEVFQRLVSEEISIRNLRSILEALIEWGQKEKDIVLLSEYVRSSLKRYISHKHSSGQNILPAYLFTPDVEDAVRNAVRQTSAGSYLALDPNTARKLVANTKKRVGDLARHQQRPVLLTSMDVRRYIRKLIEGELHELPVVSYQELTPEITVQPLGRVDLS